MKTLFSVGVLVIAGLIASKLIVFALNAVGVPGALIAGKREKALSARYVVGSLVATLCQSYVYLAYTAFVTNWTKLVVSHQGVSPFIIWPVAFLAVTQPIYWSFIGAGVEAKADGYGTNAQIEALGFTGMITLVAFFVFAFAPVSCVRGVYFWVPYMQG